MNDLERHQKSSLVSITLKILDAFEGDSFFIPKIFSQFNFSSIPHLIQKILQISLTPQTWPPTTPFSRSPHSAHPLHLWNEFFGNFLSSKVWQDCSNQMLHFPAASKCRGFIMCSCLCVHIHTITNKHFEACPQTWMVIPSQTKVTATQYNNLTESKKNNFRKSRKKQS